MEEIEREHLKNNNKYSIAKRLDQAQDRHQKRLELMQQEKDLLRLAEEAAEGGFVRMTRKGKGGSTPDDEGRNVQETMSLLELVKVAQKGGYIRLLRRKSTEGVRMPGRGFLKLEV